MSTEILNNSSKINNKNVSLNKVNIYELKRKIILKQKKEKLHKKIILATIFVGVSAISYLVV